MPLGCAHRTAFELHCNTTNNLPREASEEQGSVNPGGDGFWTTEQKENKTLS